MRRSFPRIDAKGVVKEIRQRLLEECDYLQEAQYIEAFHKIWQHDPEITIPRLHQNLSSPRVITMDYVDGMTLEEFATTASQEARNHAAGVLFRFFGRSFAEHLLFHADPHPGNYLFSPEGNISLLDFGCVRTFSADHVFAEMRLFRGLVEGEGSLAKNDEVWQNAGFHIERGFDGAAQERYLRQTFNRVLEPGVQKLTPEWWEAMANDLSRVDQVPNRDFYAPSPDGVMMTRVVFGLLWVIAQLEPEADWHRMATEFLTQLPTRKAG